MTKIKNLALLTSILAANEPTESLRTENAENKSLKYLNYAQLATQLKLPNYKITIGGGQKDKLDDLKTH